jgi:hypothetical protein
MPNKFIHNPGTYFTFSSVTISFSPFFCRIPHRNLPTFFAIITLPFPTAISSEIVCTRIIPHHHCSNGTTHRFLRSKSHGQLPLLTQLKKEQCQLQYLLHHSWYHFHFLQPVTFSSLQNNWNSCVPDSYNNYKQFHFFLLSSALICIVPPYDRFYRDFNIYL